MEAIEVKFADGLVGRKKIILLVGYCYWDTELKEGIAIATANDFLGGSFFIWLCFRHKRKLLKGVSEAEKEPNRSGNRNYRQYKAFTIELFLVSHPN